MAATFERIGLMFQICQNIYSLVNNMRDNAQSYKDRVATGQPLDSIAAVMQADAGEYLRRIKWVTDATQRNQALVANALADIGLSMPDAVSLRNSLVAIAQHTQAADLSTAQGINDEADYILANAPAFERLW